jgi:hypothetical protein
MPCGEEALMGMNCLRCATEVKEFYTVKLTRVRRLGGFTEKMYALAECPGCGHCELLANGSPLLDGMKPSTKVQEE